MKKFIYFMIIIGSLTSCSIQKGTINNELIATEKYNPETTFPRNFDETEIWFDYHHNKPLIDTTKYKTELTNL